MARDSFIRKALHSRLLLAAGFVLLVVLFFAFGRQILRNREIERTISGLKRQESDLTARNLQIGELQDALQTESYLEREARLKLGLQKPGEHVVVVQDQAQKTAPAFQDLDTLAAQGYAGDTPAPAPSALALSNPQRWWTYFFDRRRYDDLRAVSQ